MLRMTTRNTIIPMSLGLILTLGLGGTALADSHMEGGQGAYWTDGNGNAWKNANGDCWYNPNQEKMEPREECGDVIETAEPEPEPEPEPEMVKRTERINLDARTLFGFDKATLTDDGKMELDELAADIESDWEVNRIRVIGHTDRIGPEAYNMKLSERRAQAVADYLMGIPALADHDMRVVGRGESQPVVQCENTGGRNQLIECLQPNRRVEVEISGMKTVIEQKMN
ncbi:OmpA family protein [Arhodomonas sp. AD133]|uniref:OmpA family protein n=1 Tax=Arhodomonas sp. AD133 TaxID=3415009 RepID=UPI003EC0EDB2